MQSFVWLAYFWAHDITNDATIGMLGLSNKTICQWFSFFRDVCSHWLQTHPFQLGGQGVIVEIDESLVAKRKYNIGHVVEQQWIFGAIEVRPDGERLGFLRMVENRTQDTLLGI